MKKLKLFSLALMALFTTSLWATITSPYTLTLNGSGNAQTVCTALAAGTAQTDGSGTAVNSNPEVTWTLTKQGGTSTFTVARNSGGLKMGAGTSDYGGVTISSSSFASYKITKVAIVAKNQSTKTGSDIMTTTWDVTVGGTALGTQKTISNNNSDNTLNFENSDGLQGNLQIVCANTGDYKNYYFIKSISVTFTATPSTHTLTLNTNGVTYESTPDGWNNPSTGVYTKTVNHNATFSASLPDNPAKSGSTFNRWMADNTHTTALTASGAIVSDTTIYAEWTGAITYSKGGDDYAAADLSVGNPTTYVEGVGVPSFTPLANITNYDFVAWDPASISTSATGAQTVTATWKAAAVKHSITYTNLKGADNSANPTQYAEGTGVASFTALADVTDFHFTGWSPASIADTAKTNKTIDAQWVASYDVTFSAGDGSGTVPASFQKWAGGTFNLPGQGSMTAPAGKEFSGWKANGTGAKLAANSEYTMGSAAVEFVAQWKGVATTIFYYQQSNLSANLAAGSYTATGGTLTTSAEMSKESAAYNAAVPTDLIGGANVSKLGSNAAYIQLTLTSGKFQEDDTIYICGMNPYKISSTTSLTGDITDSIATGTGKKDYNVGYAIIPEGVSQSSIYLSRQQGTGTGFAAVKVIRPAEREIASTVITLSDVKVNNRSIHADSLAILKTADAYSLVLEDSYAEAPVIKFNEHKVITYADGESPATKTTDKVHTVTASLVSGEWKAQATINEITYTVTAAKPSTYSVVYKDGNTTLDTEVVLVGEHPAGITNPTKAINTFAGWKNGDDAVDPTELDGTKDQVITLQAQWTKLYATNIDFEAFIDDRGTSGKWDSLLTANNYAISSTNSVSLDAPTGKPADKGLKIKKSGTIVSFNVHAGKMVVLKTGVLSGAQISVDGGANYTDLTSASGSTGASVVSYHYNAAEAIYMIKTTTDAYNIIQSISITDPYTISCSGTTNGSLSADTLKARPNETITLTVTPADGYRIASVSYNDGTDHTIEAVQGVYSFTMPAANVTVSAAFEEDEETALDNTADELKAIKRIENGMLIIEKNGKRYNVQGQLVR